MKIVKNIDNDYQLIPMADIDDEAREIAVRWVEEFQDAGGIAIEQKHKLASDIMNYARRKAKVFSSNAMLKEGACKCFEPVKMIDRARENRCGWCCGKIEASPLL